MEIDGVKISATFDASIGELENYVSYVKERVPNVSSIKVEMCEDGMVDVNWTSKGQPFERIRRITGYLTGTLESWNDAKRAEESERVKHL